jgi:hypothetical protein
MRPYLQKNSSQKIAGGMAHCVDTEFKPQYHKKKKKKPTTQHKKVGLGEWNKW